MMAFLIGSLPACMHYAKAAAAVKSTEQNSTCSESPEHLLNFAHSLSHMEHLISEEQYTKLMDNLREGARYGTEYFATDKMPCTHAGWLSLSARCRANLLFLIFLEAKHRGGYFLTAMVNSNAYLWTILFYQPEENYGTGEHGANWPREVWFDLNDLFYNQWGCTTGIEIYNYLEAPAFKQEEDHLPVLDFLLKQPAPIIFPRSFVQAARFQNASKNLNYLFKGKLFGGMYGGLQLFDFMTAHLDPAINCSLVSCVYQSRRRWVLEFAKKAFDRDSHLEVTDPGPGYEELGSYDFTTRNRRANTHVSFLGQDLAYIDLLRRAKFTLCPGGDSPHSNRFNEAIAAGSIPIVEHPAHTGKHIADWMIPYKYYLPTDQHVYRLDWVTHNLELFNRYQTYKAS